MRLDRGAVYLALAMIVGSAVLSLGLGSLLHAVLHLSLRDVRLLVHACGPWGAPAVVLLIAAIIVVIPTSTIPIELVAGLVYGLAAGTILVLLGHMLGALIAFVLARRLGRPLLRSWLGERTVGKLDALSARSGFWLVFGMRLLPVFDFKLVSYASGLTCMRLRSYLVATLTGIFVPIAIMAAIGATAAARPREAALIAGVYSAAVAGTIAYFAIPGWNLRALAASLRRVALPRAGRRSFQRASQLLARRTRALRSRLGVGLLTLASAMAALGYHIVNDPGEDVFERCRHALAGDPAAWTIPLVLALLMLGIYLYRGKLRAPERS